MHNEFDITALLNSATPTEIDLMARFTKLYLKADQMGIADKLTPKIRFYTRKMRQSNRYPREKERWSLELIAYLAIKIAEKMNREKSAGSY